MTDDKPRRSTSSPASLTARPKVIPAARPSDDLTSAQLIEKYGNKSAAIRALHTQGYSVSEIATKVGVIYQHARNVVLRPLKRANPTTTTTPSTGDS